MNGEFSKNRRALIVLHEIYGVNRFVQRQCEKFREAGYDVFCPDLLGRPPFLYEESEEAYAYFQSRVGFEVYRKIGSLMDRLKEKYDRVFVIGYSVGATVAWRCCENPSCGGIVACYGSRIRDYADVHPVCPALLLFANEEAFDVHALAGRLENKPRVTVSEFNARHGFLDFCSERFDSRQAARAEESIARFLNECAYSISTLN